MFSLAVILAALGTLVAIAIALLPYMLGWVVVVALCRYLGWL